MLDAIHHGKQMSIKYYNNWVEHVKRTIPPERLLVFESKQGWTPLCTFFNLPIPEEPYPFLNDSGAKKWQYMKGRIVSTFLVGILFVLFGVFACFILTLPFVFQG